MRNRLRLFARLILVLPLMSASSVTGQNPVTAPSREAAVVDSAVAVLDEIMSIPGRNIPGSLLAKAEGIAIIPGLLKGGFIIGVRHGRGVIVTRDEAGRWKAPWFVQMSGGSVGWQVGIQGTDLVLVFRTKRSLENLMRGTLTIGVAASAAAGPVGREAEVATDAALKAEIYSYSRSRGLFAGVALDGAAMSVDQAATNAYYQPAGDGFSQPGQPNPLPPSASRLLQQIAKYTTTTVPAPANPGAVAATSASANAQTLRRQLAGSWQQLAALLDAPWRTYLALPGEVYVDNSTPTAEALRRSLDRFNSVAADPRYQPLIQRPEFQTTWSLLRQYSAAVSPVATQPLSLPAPPK